MENISHEQFWKLDPKTGKKELIFEKKNSYKTFDIQFSDCFKYENKLTGKTQILYQNISEEEWLNQQFVAKVTSSRDDT